ncbi:MAG: DUF3047 domain-containing protein [Gammaproteobacteria bacterium]|nr:MAG: DUF3047 domain-containing protein [Gammaproteobacteria bacterium]
MTTLKKYILALLVALITILAMDVTADLSNEETILIAHFSEMDLDDWENKSFKGETQYSIKSEEQNSYLHAESKQSASALYKKIKVNIHETPFLNWSWRIDKALPELNEKDKSGDDYAARIYVVFKTGYTPLSAKALNYVWSSNDSSESHWPNAFTDKAIMIPLRSNRDETNIWQHEKINIKEDLMLYFKKLPKYIDGVAIMTDTDNSKGIASASYGDIYFSRD